MKVKKWIFLLNKYLIKMRQFNGYAPVNSYSSTAITNTFEMRAFTISCTATAGDIKLDCIVDYFKGIIGEMPPTQNIQDAFANTITIFTSEQNISPLVAKAILLKQR